MKEKYVLSEEMLLNIIDLALSFGYIHGVIPLKGDELDKARKDFKEQQLLIHQKQKHGTT